MDFFNDLGKKFTRAARSVQEKTRDGVESTRLASDLRGAKNELEQLYAELGRACYEARGDEGARMPAGLTDAITAALLRIEELELQRDRIRQQTRCPGCGAVQAEDARFCSSCGRRMPEDAPSTPEPEDEALEYCARCGALRHGDSRYCPLCGHAYDAADLALPDREAPVQPPIHGDGPEEPAPEEIAED